MILIDFIGFPLVFIDFHWLLGGSGVDLGSGMDPVQTRLPRDRKRVSPRRASAPVPPQGTLGEPFFYHYKNPIASQLLGKYQF